MVPHSSICAKPKSDQYGEISGFLAGNGQNTHKSTRFQAFSRPSAEASRHDHRDHNQPAQPSARARAGRMPAPRTSNRQGPPQKILLATGHGTNCAISESTYIETRGVIEITPYAAVEALNLDGDHAHTRGTPKPDQRTPELQFSSISLTYMRCSVLKANNRPSTGRLFPDTPNHKPIYVSQV